MRHKKTVKKLGVKKNHRQAMMRNMVVSLLDHGRIITTHAKAKVLKSLADKMITLGKNDTVFSRRVAGRTIQNRETLKRLFYQIAPEFADRNGGYTRIIRAGFRKGDNAALSMVELVSYEPKVAESDEKDKKTEEKKK